MNRFLTCIVLLGLLPARLFAQYTPQFTQFWNTYSSFNPAAAGLHQKLNVSAAGKYGSNFYHDQYYYAGGSARILAIHGGISMSYTNNYYHISGSNFSVKSITQSGTLGYAFHIRLKDERALSVGVSGGFTGVNYSTGNFPNDSGRDVSGFGGAGLAYRGLKWRFGLSVTNLVMPRYRIGNYSYQAEWTAWLTAERDIQLGEKWCLTPRVLAGTYLDVSTVAQYNKKLWFGISSRLYSNGYLGTMAGYDFREKFRVGYSYQRFLSNSSYYNSIANVHEVVISFFLK